MMQYMNVLHYLIPFPLLRAALTWIKITEVINTMSWKSLRKYFMLLITMKAFWWSISHRLSQHKFIYFDNGFIMHLLPLMLMIFWTPVYIASLGSWCSCENTLWSQLIFSILLKTDTLELDVNSRYGVHFVNSKSEQWSTSKVAVK